MMSSLILKAAKVSRPPGEGEDEYDVLADGVVVGRIFKAAVSPTGTAWKWTMLFDYCWPNHGYAPSREAAMAAFAESWGEDAGRQEERSP